MLRHWLLKKVPCSCYKSCELPACCIIPIRKNLSNLYCPHISMLSISGLGNAVPTGIIIVYYLFLIYLHLLYQLLTLLTNLVSEILTIVTPNWNVTNLSISRSVLHGFILFNRLLAISFINPHRLTLDYYFYWSQLKLHFREFFTT